VVHDVAAALVRLLSSDLEGPVNIGSGVATPVRRVASTIAAITGHEHLLRFGARPAPIDHHRVVADTTKLREQLGWSPTVPLEEGLAATVEWWRDRARPKRRSSAVRRVQHDQETMRGARANRSRSGRRRRGPSRGASRRIPVTVLAFVVLMIPPTAATAAPGADPSNPSLHQHVESVPSSHGGPPSRGGSSPGRLSESIRHRLAAQGGSNAKQLEAVATSAPLGAPASTAAASASRAGRVGSSNAGAGTDTRASGAKPSSSGRTAAGEHAPSALHAITTAATQSGSGSVAAFLVGSWRSRHWRAARPSLVGARIRRRCWLSRAPAARWT
jgi:hypothetical protein